MRAVRFYGPGDLRLEELPDPVAGRGELVLKVECALTDGTDLKAFLRGHRLFKPPMPFGHELVGTVVQAGAGVESFRVGDRVVPANSAPCRACPYCQRGLTSLCDNLDSHLNWGAYAELLRVPAPIVAQNTLRLPDTSDTPDTSSGAARRPVSEIEPDTPDTSDTFPGVTPALAAFAATEPLACVVHGVDAAGVQPGDTVALLGATGAIGLMFVQVLRHLGAEVVAVGRSAERLALASRFGATTDVVPADVVIECTGLPEVWERAPEYLRKGGTAVMFGGTPAGSRFSLDCGRLHYDALTVKGVFHHTPATFRRALALIADGHVAIEPLIGARGGLADVEALLGRMERREIVKAAVIP
jgi:L-iditol 2-dehydrogenase